MALVMILGLGLGWVVHRSRFKRAEAAYEQAKLTRLVAEIYTEFTEGIYKQDLAAVEAAIARAESDLKATEEIPDEEVARHARTVLAQARSAKTLIKNQTIRELKEEVEKARADEMAKQAEYVRSKKNGLGLLW